MKAKSNVKPAKEVVVLKPTTKTSSTYGTIVVVEKDQPELGEVIAIGTGKLPVPFKKGDTIAYRKFGEFKYWLDGKEILFVKFEDILGVLI
jgi:co-chaperonin GroES (HSP10)